MPSEDRSKSEKGTTITRTTYMYKDRPTSVSTSTLTETFKSISMSRTSTTTPGYPHAGVNGLPINGFGFSELWSGKAIGYWRTDRPSSGGSIFGSYVETTGAVFSAAAMSLIDFTALERLNQDNAVKTALNLKLKDQKVNYAQAIAESGQVRKMILTNIKRISSAYRNLRRGNFVGAARALGLHLKSPRFNREFGKNQQKAISAGWLELQYGWLPLLSDIYGSIEVYQDLKKPKEPMIKVVAKKSFSRDLYKLTSDGAIRTEDKWRVTREVTVYCYYRRSSHFGKTMSELGLTNPALLAWELLPFSFVVDWFAQIGNYISTFDASVGTDFVKGGITSFVRQSNLRSYTGEGKKVYTPSWTHYSCQTGFAIAEYGRVVCGRTKLTSNPLASLPVIRNPVSDLHLANALALLTQTFRK